MFAYNECMTASDPTLKSESIGEGKEYSRRDHSSSNHSNKHIWLGFELWLHLAQCMCALRTIFVLHTSMYDWFGLCEFSVDDVRSA